MDYQSIISALDAEISKLVQVRKVLEKSGKLDAVLGRHAAKKQAGNKPKAKRVLSPEARKRIADAQKKRWAAARKAAK